MDKIIFKRVVDEGRCMINTGMTVREIANLFDVSKSTVHKDLTDRLYFIDINMYNEVSKILQYHMNIRHIRGGESARRKFLVKNTN